MVQTVSCPVCRTPHEIKQTRHDNPFVWCEPWRQAIFFRGAGTSYFRENAGRDNGGRTSAAQPATRNPPSASGVRLEDGGSDQPTYTCPECNQALNGTEEVCPRCSEEIRWESAPHEDEESDPFF